MVRSKKINQYTSGCICNQSIDWWRRKDGICRKWNVIQDSLYMYNFFKMEALFPPTIRTKWKDFGRMYGKH